MSSSTDKDLSRPAPSEGRAEDEESDEPVVEAKHISDVELPGDGLAARVWRELQEKSRRGT